MPREVFQSIRASRLAALRAELIMALPTSTACFVLEIGCGNGHFLAAYASAHPDQYCVGIDLRLERIAKAAYDFNASRRGRALPVKTVGEAMETVPAKNFKEVELWVKTKTPVQVLSTDNVLPKG